MSETPQSCILQLLIKYLYLHVWEPLTTADVTTADSTANVSTADVSTVNVSKANVSTVDVLGLGYGFGCGLRYGLGLGLGLVVGIWATVCRGCSTVTVLEHMLIKCIIGVIVRDHPSLAVSAALSVFLSKFFIGPPPF